jgi:tRNA dimethylallyltransferase
MDIGTAKPSAEEMVLVPHHLFDVVNPDEDFSLAQYQEIADRAIREIHARENIPFLVGGSGQYVWSVLEGWQIPRVPPDLELRKQLEEITIRSGIGELYRQLQEIDPVAAQKIDKRNVRRVIRALEVSIQAKAPFSKLCQKTPPEFESLIIGLTAERAELYRRIDHRVDQMIEQGFFAEVERLNQMKYDYRLPSMSSIGYSQIGLMLKEKTRQEETIRRIKVDNHRFVRHQYAWFRLKDQRIHWFDICSRIEPEIMKLIDSYF